MGNISRTTRLSAYAVVHYGQQTNNSGSPPGVATPPDPIDRKALRAKKKAERQRKKK